MILMMAHWVSWYILHRCEKWNVATELHPSGCLLTSPTYLPTYLSFSWYPFKQTCIYVKYGLMQRIAPYLFSCFPNILMQILKYFKCEFQDLKLCICNIDNTTCNFFLGGHPRPLFHLLSLFSNNLQNKTVDCSEIRTQIVGVEGKQVDSLATTTALATSNLLT